MEDFNCPYCCHGVYVEEDLEAGEHEWKCEECGKLFHVLVNLDPVYTVEQELNVVANLVSGFLKEGV